MLLLGWHKLKIVLGAVEIKTTPQRQLEKVSGNAFWCFFSSLITFCGDNFYSSEPKLSVGMDHTFSAMYNASAQSKGDHCTQWEQLFTGCPGKLCGASHSKCQLCFTQSGDLELRQHPTHCFFFFSSLQRHLKFQSATRKFLNFEKPADYQFKIFTSFRIYRYQPPPLDQNSVPRDWGLICNKYCLQKQH